MKEYAKAFYTGKAWRKLSKLYMTMKNYICERCGEPAEICHHKIYITPKNLQDINITLNIDNLECLCRNCHNKEHFLQESKSLFDESGQLIAVKESKDIENHKNAVERIDGVLSDFKRLNDK